MSKIGEKPITLPQGVTVEYKGNIVTVKGQQGSMDFTIPSGLSVVIEDNTVKVTRKHDEKKLRAMHGLYQRLISNAIEGFVKPWEKTLEIVGTGYNVKLQGEELVLKLGFSHPVVVKKTEGVKYTVSGNNKIILSGIDKQLVGELAHKIRIIKKPDAYKGKGIKYLGEKLRIKPGKKAKTAGAA